MADATVMPFGRRKHARDLAASAGKPDNPGDGANQSAPVLLSSAGRVVHSERPFAFSFDGDGLLRLDGPGITVDRHGETLRDAFLATATPSGRTPAREMFTAPQYNTWIEMPYAPTQEGVLAYARRISRPGVLMIDDNWAQDYGTWRFDRARFPDPRDMMKQLHDQGFHVMLWVVPFVSPDSATFRELDRRGLLITTPPVQRWWNGYSATLDLTNPAAVAWLHGELDALITEYDVDGFKFDAGDLHFYDSIEQCEAWARIGLRYPVNEYRACWKMGGHPLAQRLADKPPSWDADGLASLVPGLIAQGLIGHAFTCPDMIGGGEIDAVTRAGGTDQELFVRYAQIAALAPMMQFSTLPDRVLDAPHRAALNAALDLRTELLPLILALVDHAATTGEPVIRPMAYHAPALTDVTDQFFLGPDLIVAPVIERGAHDRTVVLPAGTWESSDGHQFAGPATVTAPVSLISVPRFRRLAGRSGTQ